MSNTQQILKEKISRLKATIDLRPHDRIPIVAQADFWPVRYSKKYTIQEAFYSIDVLAECYKVAFSEWHEWDAFDTIMYSLGPMLDATGSIRFSIPGKNISPDAEFQHRDLTLMGPEEYGNLIRNPMRFHIEYILPRLCRRVGSDDPTTRTKALAKAAIFFGQWIKKAKHYSSLWSNAYGIPPALRGTAVYMPMDWIADKLRGIRNGLIDVKERTEELQAACEALVPFLIEATLPVAATEGDYPLVFNPQHVSPFLSPRDYDRVFWPTFKKMIDQFIMRGYKVWVFLENQQEQHLERLQDLPKGKVVAHMENTDLATAKKFLGGKICIAGGMPAVLLARGTPDDIKNQTVSILKLFEDEPGFVMTCGTPLPVNARPENIHAWLKSVRDYGRIGSRTPLSGNGKHAGRKADRVGAAGGKGSKKDYSAQNIHTPWEKVRADFGKIEGNESIIKEKWEQLEKSLIPFIYWLIK